MVAVLGVIGADVLRGFVLDVLGVIAGASRAPGIPELNARLDGDAIVGRNASAFRTDQRAAIESLRIRKLLLKHATGKTRRLR